MKFIPVSNWDESYWKVGMDDFTWAEYKNFCGCSYNVLPARLLQMEYPSYLKYLRSLGADLRGNVGYVYATFKDKKTVEELCKRLNKEWSKIKIYIEGEGE